MKVKVINKSKNDLPSYSTLGSAGMDVRANIIEYGSITLEPMGKCIIPTGLYFKIPEDTFLMITPRSGLAAKYGISIVNSPGILDSDYIDELKIILINLGDTPFKINSGDRIAQIILMNYNKVEFEIVEELDETERKGGFGSTGIK